jgi:AcrR family transcriptional regulator
MVRGAGPVIRDAKKAATRRALVEHAVALFCERGFEKTTVDDIVAAAGCSQRTFFRHFAAKEDVVFDGVPERLDDLAELLAHVPAEEPGWTAVRDNMRLLTRRYTDEDPELTAVRIRLWMTEPLLYARWTEISLTWERELTRFLVSRRSGGHAPDGFDLDAEVAAAAVVAALRAAWRGEVLHGGRFDELVRQALGLLERGLADL